MTLLNENFGKELQRMSELAGIQRTTITENSAKVEKQTSGHPEVLKEEDDLLGDIGDIFAQQTNVLQGKPASMVLSKDLKAAMVLNNVSEYQAALLGVYTNYNPKTKGAEVDTEKGTLYAKSPIEKFAGGSEEISGMKYHDADKLSKAASLTGKKNVKALDKELERQKKISSLPVSWGENPDAPENIKIKDSLAKWQPLHKDESIISYEKQVDKFGHETFTLSDRGKQQLEFLARMYSDNPLRPNGDPNIDIESALTDKKFIYKNVVTANAEKIIRDFFNKAVVPIVATSLKRTSAAPKDSQFERFVRAGVDHAIDQTKKGKYNSDKYSNYGAWFMQVVKNKVIDQLKSQTTFKLDTGHVYDMLSNMPGPLKVDSQLNPSEATGNYDSVEQSKHEFKSNGLKKNYFTYVYNKPDNALADLDAQAVKTDTGFKKSPLRAQYLREPGMFYKSSIEHMPAHLSQATVEPAYFEKHEDVPANVLLRIAKTEVVSILQQIAQEIVVSNAKTGDEVRLSGRENAKYPNLTKGKSYKVIEKTEEPVPGGGKPKKFYFVTDDNGEKSKVSARALTPVETVGNKIVSKARENERTVVELLRLLLQYGHMKPVYTKTVYLPKAEGGWATKNVGEAVAKDKNGVIILPYASQDSNSRFNSLETAPIEFVWSSEKYSDETNEKIIDDLVKTANAKGLVLPAQYFGADNQPLYKQKSGNAAADLKRSTLEFINGIRNALRKYFGFSTIDNPIIKKNRDILKKLLDNWSKSQESESEDTNLAESHIRKIVKNLIYEKFKTKVQLKK